MKKFSLFIFLLFFFLLPTCVYGKEKDVVVQMSEWKFSPDHFTIKVGQKVVFKNVGKEQHWPASNIHPTHDIYPEFDPKTPVKPGKSWSFVFDKPGEWRFHDHLAPETVGLIKVTGKAKTSNVVYLFQFTGDAGEKLKELPYDIKYLLAKAYFFFFPQDLERYLAKQNITWIITKKNEEQLAYVIKVFGPERVVRRLFVESGAGRYFNCHADAHSIGRMAYRVLGDQALYRSITLCQSGYHHGVMAEFVYQNGTENILQKVDAVCKKGKTRFMRLTCYHGAGHGFMAYLDYNLFDVLGTCKKFSTSFKRTNCYVGAYMENIGSLTGDALTTHRTSWLSKYDLLYPCDRLPNDPAMVSACYSIQPSWMTWVLYKNGEKNIMQKIADECSKAPYPASSSCFFGYGMMAGLRTKFHARMVIPLCMNVPKEKNFQEKCFAGAQTMLLDYWGLYLTTQGDVYCAALPSEYEKNCYSRLNNRKKDNVRAKKG